MTLYEILGVASDANPDDIKLAFRLSASKNHPDRGGDPKVMAEINRAYETLSDPERREQYDRTGDGNKPETDEDVANTRFLQMLAEAVFRGERYHQYISDLLRSQIVTAQDILKRMVRDENTLNSLHKKATRKDGGPNKVQMVIENQLLMIAAARDQQHHELKILNLVQEALVKYDDPAPPQEVEKDGTIRIVPGFMSGMFDLGNLK